MPDIQEGAGLLDTSVLVDPARSSCLPSETLISTLSLAELAAGPHVSADPTERSRRQHHLQVVEATFEPLPFDAACARAYGSVFSATATVGRKPRGRRAVDLLIAATALANDLPLYTCNARDFEGLADLVRVVDASNA